LLLPINHLVNRTVEDGLDMLRSLTATILASSTTAPAAARVSAANAMLDRGWDRAPQVHSGEDGGDIRIVIRQIVSEEEEPLLLEHEPLGK
jgi:hypothetical protein